MTSPAASATRERSSPRAAPSSSRSCTTVATDRRRLGKVVLWAAIVGAIGVLVQLPISAALATGLGLGAISHEGVLGEILADGVGAQTILVLIGLAVATTAVLWKTRTTVTRAGAVAGGVAASVAFAFVGPHDRHGTALAGLQLRHRPRARRLDLVRRHRVPVPLPPPSAGRGGRRGPRRRCRRSLLATRRVRHRRGRHRRRRPRLRRDPGAQRTHVDDLREARARQGGHRRRHRVGRGLQPLPARTCTTTGRGQGSQRLVAPRVDGAVSR